MLYYTKKNVRKAQVGIKTDEQISAAEEARTGIKPYFVIGGRVFQTKADWDNHQVELARINPIAANRPGFNQPTVSDSNPIGFGNSAHITDEEKQQYINSLSTEEAAAVTNNTGQGVDPRSVMPPPATMRATGEVSSGGFFDGRTAPGGYSGVGGYNYREGGTASCGE